MAKFRCSGGSLQKFSSWWNLYISMETCTVDRIQSWRNVDSKYFQLLRFDIYAVVLFDNLTLTGIHHTLSCLSDDHHSLEYSVCSQGLFLRKEICVLGWVCSVQFWPLTPHFPVCAPWYYRFVFVCVGDSSNIRLFMVQLNNARDADSRNKVRGNAGMQACQLRCAYLNMYYQNLEAKYRAQWRKKWKRTRLYTTELGNWEQFISMFPQRSDFRIWINNQIAFSLCPFHICWSSENRFFKYNYTGTFWLLLDGISWF